MKIALLTVAMLGSQATFPVSDQVPGLNVEATCKAGVGADKAGHENDARQQLSTIWLTSSDAVRNECVGEATAGGSDSYVDLLTCLQMAIWDKSSPLPPKLKGASKNRNKP